MKILHVTTCLTGGAGIACRRINDALNRYGIESSILTKPDFIVKGYAPSVLPYRFWRKLSFYLMKFSHTANPIFHSSGLVSTFDVERLNCSSADIIHLHWINDEFLSIRDIAHIRKPLVWTLHDSWPFCGAEHHPNLPANDRRYAEGYSRRNFPATSSGLDYDRYIWLYKRFYWKNLKMSFVAPSNFELNLCKESIIGRQFPARRIPHPLDLNIFSASKEQHSSMERTICFGACSLQDPNKGFELLRKALNILKEKNTVFKIRLLCFGKTDPSILQGTGFPNEVFGSVSKETDLAKIYRKANVFICPSLIESFSYTTAEALACGLPVTAFAEGGLPDMITQKWNGYLAAPYDPEDLAEGILYCLHHCNTLSANARERAEKICNPARIAQQYLSLYEEILRSKK